VERITFYEEYNSGMQEFHFYHPIEVRYGDLDPQGHVNNAKYLTYLETGRMAYVRHLGLLPDGSFLDLGMILAALQIDFREPILFGQSVRVGVRVESIGNKSMKMAHAIEDANDGHILATAACVLVAYNYHTNETMPVPNTWRKAISEFEGLTEIERRQ
jgi:acyl-CoA thioester hydrolase